ncbi:type II toxin-antitoxin system Phd/YefM family antitoxin [uncultured Sphingomonas sp.]|uniref:type II toxin-antitoxin system Phd/YefM family antitoxin n=1 Tax=uncultured Sphingomonas sp. TaxID=158754 RepID=UPI002619BB1C|nr:type II toxin-antitoxin system Phd/YefM family antitoxin [uncultured Sphingomonas sp.]
MPQTVSSVEASKAFGRISRQALVAPLTITHHGHDSLVLMSAAEYQRLKRRDREVYALNEVPEEIADAVRSARAPAEADAFNHEVGS